MSMFSVGSSSSIVRTERVVCGGADNEPRARCAEGVPPGSPGGGSGDACMAREGKLGVLYQWSEGHWPDQRSATIK
eukprot:10410030-Alexandrium_andersonii.AAC.1